MLVHKPLHLSLDVLAFGSLHYKVLRCRCLNYSVCHQLASEAVVVA